MSATVPVQPLIMNAMIAQFRGAASLAGGGEGLFSQRWSDDDWCNLFRYTTLRQVSSGDPLIRRGESDRSIYFVLRGQLEIIVHSGHGISLGPVSHAGVGAVLGEASFFDGKPRSATVWPVTDCEVAAMTMEQFDELEKNHPNIARDLLFTMGGVLASRLRQTTARVVTSY